LARFFSGLNRFFSVWVRFGSFFWFQAYKTETEPVGFFKILIGFFHGLVFSVIYLFFSGFLDFLGFSVFFLVRMKDNVINASMDYKQI
jgi:hypothetical protein